ncbi:MAG: hypothetical protein B7Y11_10700 [Sphingobacteriia bacterium 24-36-13]|jgi:NAD-dependent deacetylase|uniref:SIR2 family NAD-dependent protein deacylase n=1 Tax=Sediminibacterium sp. TaxID=1917865 RepID=UPI000BD5DAFC|nr:Sir2 family NAD-dependent protein deacetylase [Sediminibacterium sp.]OYY08824.1 MAG: hypothetical protein B7Y66_10130 [Sphingobacteriia bacterium 35-36-14]OYZ53191.1 MAG: hypothetical protein B7Y11_10700 [Sphingobacteriia bacterium 24-36-13]OZA65874.1 MAG: hypothetical protein B7X68_02565 [Sphingobacteriia bacterium 39-36-14]HQS24665.1 Sir2 family NAD-dependent protein deacetylase [Sediminibacterium sp.]HQS34187.1 Sir2 family NAD-dependent protein deacetylase [Sediminibacterium sp.]
MKNTVVITGAGVSVESGIQPFRGKNGLWNENPTEMATNRYFRTNTSAFLQWYYHRFVSCKDALPNKAHEILAKQNIKLITQNVDNLHVKAQHPSNHLIEIHGNINFKRKINAEYITELELANWNQVADTIIFMGTSNSVGFTYGALQVGVHNHKKVVVVDPNPAPSFNHPGVEIIKETATDFCSRYF